MLKSEKGDYLVMKNLGLTQIAIRCYQSLYLEGPASILQLAKRLELQPTGLYRYLNQLNKWGYVSAVKAAGQPIYFYAVRLDRALVLHEDYRRKAVADLVLEQKLHFTS